MASKLVLSLALLAAAGSPAAPLPKPGSYAFNWLEPETASCHELAAKDIAALKKCADSANAFGLDLPSKACRVSAKVEWIVYATKAQCQQALETMQANAP